MLYRLNVPGLGETHSEPNRLNGPPMAFQRDYRRFLIIENGMVITLVAYQRFL